jgi:drug/metabolite transporter (DMT)-like permease
VSSTRPIVAFAVATAGIAVFSCMDAVMKGLSLAIGTYNALFWRSLVGVVLAGAVYLVRGRPVRPTRAALRLHMARGAVATVMAVLFFWGLARVPMAQAVALTFIAPLIAIFLAGVLLGEPVSRRAVGASLAASVGVLIILAGQAHAETKLAALTPYQVDAALMAMAKPDAKFMHCLPAHREEEVTSEVIDGPQSLIWQEAENRLHAQKSVLRWCFGQIG